jgi:diguanylate cyclase (GGDEF)-like protein
MRVLIAEDDPISRRQLCRLLGRWEYEVLETSNGAQAWEIFQRGDAPPLAILDAMMPGLDGAQLCRRVREQDDAPFTYLILLTERGGNEILAGSEAGADDFLAKPVDARELRARLSVGCRILDLQSRLRAALETLQDRVGHDALTLLWNHSAILDILHRELSRSHRHDRPLSLILAKLDRFQEIIESAGPQAGDLILREASHRIRISVRPYDQVGRYGGDEFLIVLPDCDLASALGVAERVRRQVGDSPVRLTSGADPVTVSVGVATSVPGAAIHKGALLRAVQIALSRAREGGRNRIGVALPADLPAQRPLLSGLETDSGEVGGRR